MKEKAPSIPTEIAEKALKICPAVRLLIQKPYRRIWVDTSDSITDQDIRTIGCKRSKERSGWKKADYSHLCVFSKSDLVCPAGEKIKEEMVALRPGNIV